VLKLGREFWKFKLKPELTKDPEFLMRFRAEARAAANLSHPNIVTVHDFGQDQRTHYMVLEYVEGQNLKEFINQEAPFDVESTLLIMIELCKGLGYAHRAGRTGRAGARGVALSLVGPREWNLMLSIQRYLGLRFARDTVAGLEARFQGPKKQKKSGKPVGRKTKKNKKAKKRAAEAAAKAPKIKKRLRDRKNIGKRRKPVAPRAPDVSTE